MSAPVVIRAENLGKRYRLGDRSERSGDGLRHAIDDLVKSPARLLRRLRSGASAGRREPEEFWALKDVSFEIRQGEVVGIIGRNGAGKSTLLKILSRISEPTTGRIGLKGRVASLLEVGTGFHPELTGRENIFLNGAILGMTRAEIRAKFDEIVAFAEVDKFLDTPVKRYSSGMYVRLAFAVAAHLEPEILIVDEVLAVGDAEFQKKCLGKMEQIRESGRTVIFVSHQMASVAALTSRCLLLSEGKVIEFGPTKQVLNSYLKQGGFSTSPRYLGKPNKNGAWIKEAVLKSADGKMNANFLTYEDVVLEIDWVNEKNFPTIVGFQLNNLHGVIVMTAYDTPADWDGSTKKENATYRTRTLIPRNLLPANQYSLHLALDCPSPRACLDVHFDALHFTIHDPMDEKCITRGAIKNTLDYMAVLPALEWNSKKIGSSTP